MAAMAGLPLATLRRRHILAHVQEALADSRVVLIAGARQAGKSTLARVVLAGRPEAAQFTLDDAATLAAARDDPAGFIRHDATVFIDEIQRAPQLLLAIKAAVDRTPAPGRFLLTGSADVLAMARVADALPGRMEVIELWPFSQGEIEGQIDGFVDRAFAGWAGRTATTLSKQDYLRRAERGGFPDVVLTRDTERRRAAWFDSYVAALTRREARDIAGVERPEELRQLLRLLAARSGQLLKVEEVARDAGLAPTTARRYIRLLEAAYIVRTLPGWATSKTTRAVRAPKVYVCDTGLLCHLLGVTADAMAAPSSADAGAVLETFVTMELARQVGWSDTRANLFHFRSKDGTEVDAVLEAADGRLVGVEVKAGATVRSEDFRGLRLLMDKVGDRFRGGLVLYTGTETLSFGDKLRCAPISSLWTTEGGN
jgi:predicted AAA+ superfamily ATPase